MPKKKIKKKTGKTYIVTMPFYYNGVFYAKGQKVKEKLNEYCEEAK